MGEQHAAALDAASHEPCGDLFRADFARLVAVEGEVNHGDAGGDQGVFHLLGKTLDAVSGGDVAVSVFPKGERIKQGLAQDDFAGGERGGIPRAAMRPRQVEVPGEARREVVQELAAVEADYVAGGVEDGHD